MKKSDQSPHMAPHTLCSHTILCYCSTNPLPRKNWRPNSRPWMTKNFPPLYVDCHSLWTIRDPARFYSRTLIHLKSGYKWSVNWGIYRHKILRFPWSCMVKYTGLYVFVAFPVKLVHPLRLLPEECFKQLISVFIGFSLKRELMKSRLSAKIGCFFWNYHGSCYFQFLKELSYVSWFPWDEIFTNAFWLC